MIKPCISVFVFVALCTPAPAQTVPHPQWVGTWATSPYLADGPANLRVLSGATLREIAHISIGGTQVRIRFTNAYGVDPLTISDAHVALSAGGGSILPGSDHAITFGGANTVNVPPGAEIFSDPVSLQVAPLSNVAVSMYLPPQVMRAETIHVYGDQDNFLAEGDVAGSPELEHATVIPSWYFFDGIDVAAAPGSYSIVTIGDSITDGAYSTRNANGRWPDVLASRLQADSNHKNAGVLNAGIAGNRVVNEGTGPSALSRIDREVLSRSGVRYVIVLESINDIGRLAYHPVPVDDVTAEELEWAFRQIVDAAHEHGIKVIGATLTPYGGAVAWSERGERVRETLNNWIRASGVFDGVADFDKITQDPANPTHFAAKYDSGDHLHPNDAGHQAMGSGIDLSLFAQ